MIPEAVRCYSGGPRSECLGCVYGGSDHRKPWLRSIERGCCGSVDQRNTTHSASNHLSCCVRPRLGFFHSSAWLLTSSSSLLFVLAGFIAAAEIHNLGLLWQDQGWVSVPPSTVPQVCYTQTHSRTHTHKRALQQERRIKTCSKPCLIIAHVLWENTSSGRRTVWVFVFGFKLSDDARDDRKARSYRGMKPCLGCSLSCICVVKKGLDEGTLSIYLLLINYWFILGWHTIIKFVLIHLAVLMARYITIFQSIFEIKVLGVYWSLVSLCGPSILFKCKKKNPYVVLIWNVGSVGKSSLMNYWLADWPFCVNHRVMNEFIDNFRRYLELTLCGLMGTNEVGVTSESQPGEKETRLCAHAHSHCHSSSNLIQFSCHFSSTPRQRCTRKGAPVNDWRLSHLRLMWVSVKEPLPTSADVFDSRYEARWGRAEGGPPFVSRETLKAAFFPEEAAPLYLPPPLSSLRPQSPEPSSGFPLSVWQAVGWVRVAVKAAESGANCTLNPSSGSNAVVCSGFDNNAVRFLLLFLYIYF